MTLNRVHDKFTITSVINLIFIFGKYVRNTYVYIFHYGIILLVKITSFFVQEANR